MMEIIKAKPEKQILQERLNNLNECLRIELAGEQPSKLYIEDLKDTIKTIEDRLFVIGNK